MITEPTVLSQCADVRSPAPDVMPADFDHLAFLADFAQGCEETSDVPALDESTLVRWEDGSVVLYADLTESQRWTVRWVATQERYEGGFRLDRGQYDDSELSLEANRYDERYMGDA